MRPSPTWFRPALAAVLLLAAGPARAASTVDISFEKYRLANGLEVLLHVDRTVPTVHVEVWYKVGSKDEVPGRTGFAHLFEHIMFQGTRHIPEDAFFKYLSEAGASNRNGSTSHDRTNYYETLPANQIELGLWLESSRMGFLLERPSFKATLDIQRDVVKNERRQRVENQPMGGVMKVVNQTLFPINHPYHHEVIGSMDDLTAASEDDIKSFFHRYYAPNNAILIIAGDIDVPVTKGLIEKYFAPIPAGPPIRRRAVPPTGFAGEKRIAMEAKVNLPTEFMFWHTMPLFAPGDAEMDVLSGVLSGGKSSRLYRRLVYDLKIAQSVNASQASRMHAGYFQISFTPLAGHTVAEIEKVIDQEIERIRTEPVSERELQRVKNQIRTDFFRGLESLQGRASRLLDYDYYAGDPAFISKHLAAYQSVDAEALRGYAEKHLHKNRRLVITVEPNSFAPIMGRIKP